MGYASNTFSNEWNLSGNALAWGTANKVNGDVAFASGGEDPTPVLTLSVDVLLDGVDPSYYSIYKTYDAIYSVANTGTEDLTDVVLTYTIGTETLSYTFETIAAGESVTFTAAAASETVGTLAINGFVTDPVTSSAVTASDSITFVSPNVVTSNSDNATTVGSFRWVLANAEAGHDIVFNSAYSISVVNGTLSIANATIEGANSTIKGGAGSQNIILSGTTTVKNLTATNRFIGNTQFIAAGSVVTLENFSYTTSQGEVSLDGAELYINNSSIAANTSIGGVISSNTALTVNGTGSRFTGDYNVAGGSLSFITSAAAETTAMLTVSGAITVNGSLRATLTDLSALATYVLVSGTGVSVFDGKTFTVNGLETVVNGDIVTLGDAKFALTTDANKLYLSIVDVRPIDAVTIDDWPASWISAPAYAYVAENVTGNFYSGENATIYTTVQVNGNGLGTVFGGTTTAIDVPAYIQVTGKTGTVFGGGDGADGADTYIQLKDTSRVYNVYGGGKNGAAGAATMVIEGGSVNYLFGGGYNSTTESVNITMDGGSVWKFYGGAASGSISGDIVVDVNSGAITNAFFGAGIGSVGGNVTVTFGADVDFSSKPIIYGGAMAGVSSAMSSATAEMEKLTSDGTQNVTISGKVAMTFNETALPSMIVGGNFNNAGETAVSSAINGGVALTFNNTSATSWIFGGSYVASGNAQDTISNGVTLDFTGNGTYFHIFGGSRVEKGGSGIVSNVDITISGGDYTGYIAAGGYATSSSSSLVTGDTAITVNTTDAVVSFGNSIYLGGYAHLSDSIAQVNGDSTIIFTGLGSNLNFSGSVNGCGFGDGDASMGGEQEIVFVDFTGDFNGIIREFDTISFAGDTAVNFTAELTPELFDTWNFDLSGRTSVEAVATIKNSAEISLTEATTERNIFVDTADMTGESGSYLIIDSVDDLLGSLDGMVFDFGINIADGDVIDNELITNSEDWLSAAGYNWKLECDGNQLLLAWESTVIPDPVIPPDAGADLLAGSDWTNDVVAEMATVTLDEMIDWRKSEQGLLA